MTIHLIWGDDLNATNNAVEGLINKFIPNEFRAFNLSRLDGNDPNQSKKAIEEIQSPGFCNSGRVVILKRSPIFNGCSTDISILFNSVVENIPLNTHLISINSNKPDQRLTTTKIFKKLMKEAKAFEYSYKLPLLWDQQGQVNLVQKLASEMQISIEQDAINILIESVGSDSLKLKNELEKLLLIEEYKSNKDKILDQKIKIKKENIELLITGIKTNALEIANYLLNDDLGNAIHRFDSLLGEGEPPLRIIATLVSQARGWLWVSLLSTQNHNAETIAKKAGIKNPKRIYIIKKQINQTSPKKLINILNSLLDIEFSIKQGANPKNAFRDGLIQ